MLHDTGGESWHPARMEAPAPSAALVLGIGNSLLADEGAGIHALRRLADQGLPAGVALVDGGTHSFSLLEWIETADILVTVDAADLGARPGTVRVFRGPALDRFLAAGGRSVHEVNLGDLLQIAALRRCLPRHRALVGIQPGRIGWGLHTSEPVAQGVSEACVRVRALLAEWLA